MIFLPCKLAFCRHYTCLLFAQSGSQQSSFAMIYIHHCSALTSFLTSTLTIALPLRRAPESWIPTSIVNGSLKVADIWPDVAPQ